MSVKGRRFHAIHHRRAARITGRASDPRHQQAIKAWDNKRPSRASDRIAAISRETEASMDD